MALIQLSKFFNFSPSHALHHHLSCTRHWWYMISYSESFSGPDWSKVLLQAWQISGETAFSLIRSNVIYFCNK
jgi:hypothetical protein